MSGSDGVSESDGVSASEGAHAQLGSLVRSHGDRLLGFAYQLTHDRGSAQDVVQEALTRLLDHARRRPLAPDNWAAYTRQAVLNEFLRRNRRFASREIVRADFADRAQAGSFEAAVAEHDRVWAALAELPARQQAALVLRYYEDLPDRSIAAALDCREATVRSLVSRGLSALRTGTLNIDRHARAADKEGTPS